MDVVGLGDRLLLVVLDGLFYGHITGVVIAFDPWIFNHARMEINLY